MKNNLNYVWKVDIIRGIAISLVFLYHLQLAIFPGYNIEKYKYGILDIFHKNYLRTLLNVSPANYGGLGVTLFFFISGFVIHFGHIRNAELKPNWLEYFSKRFFRIYPPYFVALVLFIFLNVFNIEWTNPNIISHFFMFHNYSSKYIMSINPSFWSLAVEVQFYLLYPLFLYFRKKIGIDSIVIILVVCSLIWSYLHIAYPALKHIDFLPLLNVILLFYTWVLGARLAEGYIVENRKITLSKKQIVIFWILSYVLLLTEMYRYGGNLIVVACLYFTIEHYLYSPEQEKVKNGYLHNFLINLGLCSYSFYLFHQPLLDMSIRMMRSYNLKPLIFTLGCLSITLVIYFFSKLSYKYLEISSLKLRVLLKRNSNLH